MPRRKTDDEFRKEVKALVGDEYLVLGHYEGCNTKIEFKHKKCGLSFKMRPNGFLQGHRCPNCAWKGARLDRRKTDFEFKRQVKALVGNEYIPVSEYKGSKAKIYFLHKKCGFLFQMAPNNFINQGHRCPHCSYQKLGKSHRISEQEFQRKVKAIDEGQYYALTKYQGNKNKVLMIHLLCHSKFYMTPNNFFRGARCPYCQRKKMARQKTTPLLEIKRLVAQLTNSKIKIIDSSYKNKFCPAIFYHKKCGNLFRIAPNCFLKTPSCPFCRHSVSRGEKTIKKYLTRKNICFESQFRIKDCKDKTTLPFDFAVFNKDKSLNCLIEYQGRQHFYDPFTWKRKHGPFNLQSILNTQKHDAMKLKYCKDHGIKLIRINHPQTSSKSNSIEFIERLVNRTLNKELHVV